MALTVGDLVGDLVGVLDFTEPLTEGALSNNQKKSRVTRMFERLRRWEDFK